MHIRLYLSWTICAPNLTARVLRLDDSCVTDVAMQEKKVEKQEEKQAKDELKQAEEKLKQAKEELKQADNRGGESVGSEKN